MVAVEGHRGRELLISVTEDGERESARNGATEEARRGEANGETIGWIRVGGVHGFCRDEWNWCWARAMVQGKACVHGKVHVVFWPCIDGGCGGTS